MKKNNCGSNGNILSYDVLSLAHKTKLKSGQDDVTISEGKDTVQLTIPMMVKRWNGRKIILAPGGIDATEPDQEEPNAIAKKLAQAYRLMKMIEAGKYPTRTMLAEELALDPSNVVKTLNLLNLSPKIQKMIVEGDLPAIMTLKRLYGEIPAEWERQEKVVLKDGDGLSGLMPPVFCT